MKPLNHSSMGRRIAAIAVGLILGSGAMAAAPAPRHFDIGQQNLASALSEFAQQSDRQILFSTEVVEAKRSNGVKGELAPEAALRQLLLGTGLTFRVTGDRTILVEGNKALTSGAATEEGNSGFGNVRVAQADPSASTTEQGNTAAPSEAGAEKTEATQLEELEEIVVTAQKRVERLSEVPISISVLNGRDLDASTDDTLNDAISRVAGVYSFDGGQGGGTKFAIRGVTSNTDMFQGASTVGYYLDEVPFGFVAINVLPDANAYDLERVEVLRGPQGTLYGANALNGVIRILTADADLNEFAVKTRGSISTTENGGENYRADAAINVPLVPDKLGVRAVLGYSDLSGWIDQTPGSGDADFNDGEIKTARLKLNAKPAKETGVELLAWFNRDDRGGPSISTTFDGELRPTTREEPISTDYDILGVTLTHAFPLATLVSATSYMDYQNRGTLDLGDFLGAPVDLITTIGAQLLSQEIRLSSTGTGPWQWSIGGIYRDVDETIRSELEAFSPGQPQFIERFSESYAAFGELKRIFADGLIDLSAGLRYFHDRMAFSQHQFLAFLPSDPEARDIRNEFSATTPRVVLTLHPTDDLNVYGSYSQGFRSGFPLANAQVVRFPSLKPVEPDKLTNYEIGAKGSLLGKRINYEAAVYYIDWQDTQQVLTVPVPPTGAFESIPLNSESVSGPGFDLALDVALTDALNLSVSAGWNDLEFDADVFSSGLLLFNKGDRPDESPGTTLRGEINYTMPVGGAGLKARFMAAANYTSKTSSHATRPDPLDTDPTDGVPTVVWVADGDDFLNGQLQLTLLAPDDRWTAMLFADNVLNEDPAIRPTAATDIFHSRVRPRTIGVQLEVRF